MTAGKKRACVGRARARYHHHRRAVYLALAAVVVPALLSSTLVCGAGIDLAEESAGGNTEKDSSKMLTEQVCYDTKAFYRESSFSPLPTV